MIYWRIDLLSFIYACHMIKRFTWTFIGILPSDNLIYDFLLLQATSSQIDTCCLYAFVSHQVGKQGYIVELLQEILGFLQDFR